MMNTEEYLSRSRLFQHLKNGAHGQLIELYTARLIEDGLASSKHLAVPQCGWRSFKLDCKQPLRVDQPR